MAPTAQVNFRSQLCKSKWYCFSTAHVIDHSVGRLWRITSSESQFKILPLETSYLMTKQQFSFEWTWQGWQSFCTVCTFNFSIDSQRAHASEFFSCCIFGNHPMFCHFKHSCLLFKAIPLVSLGCQKKLDCDFYHGHFCFHVQSRHHLVDGPSAIVFGGRQPLKCQVIKKSQERKLV